MEAPGPPARQRNGAAGCSVERARGRVWSSLGTTVTLEQNMVETMMMVWQSWILGLPPLLEIGIFLEGDFAGVRGGRGHNMRFRNCPYSLLPKDYSCAGTTRARHKRCTSWRPSTRTNRTQPYSKTSTRSGPSWAPSSTSSWPPRAAAAFPRAERRARPASPRALPPQPCTSCASRTPPAPTPPTSSSTAPRAGPEPHGRVCTQSEPTQSCRPTEWQMAVVAFHR